MTPEDMDDFMEYVAAPPDVGMGKMRAKWGHPKPWTETLDRVYVQIGNEPVTFNGTGWWGPDYKEGLIARAKSSPYYSEKLAFTVNKQPVARVVAKNTPNMDALAINNYLSGVRYRKELETYLNTQEKRFKYVFAYPYHKWTQALWGNKWRALPTARDFGLELAIYEGGNYHMTHGDAPPEPRNEIVTGIGGQVNCVNSMLFIMREHDIRAQNHFNLAQFSFAGGGSFGSGVRVRLWGQVTNLSPDKRRLRPGFLAASAANKVIGGDMMKTVHEGTDPTFSAKGRFQPDRGKEEIMTVEGVPVLYSYAFKEGNRRGLIITSLDTSRERPVEIQFEGEVAGGKATQWLLTADDITANNEPEHEPQIHIRESTVEGFRSGYAFDMPPFSLIAFEWEVH